LSANAGKDAVYAKDAVWENVVRRYNRLHRRRGFVPSSDATPDSIVMFLAANGERRLAARFLRNLDLSRGRKISGEYARMRHVCETVHHAMKRWVNFDVRGLRKKFAEVRTALRVMVCQMLCLIFAPYEVRERGIRGNYAIDTANAPQTPPRTRRF